MESSEYDGEKLSNYYTGPLLYQATNSSTAHIKSLDIGFMGDVVERYDFRRTASKTSRGLMDYEIFIYHRKKF